MATAPLQIFESHCELIEEKGNLKIQKIQQFSVLKTLDSIKIFPILALTIWLAHFWHSADFGLYTDDYNFIARPMGMTAVEFGNLIQKITIRFVQGRPVGFIIVYSLAFLGNKLGGLKLIYGIAYIIATINAWLFYILLKRLLNQSIFTIPGALAFCLFPADTTQAFLTHIHIYPGMTFLLIAFHCYLSEKTKLSYLIVLGSLLSYETLFPVFLAAPFLKNLKKKWNGKLIKELVRHSLILGLLMIGAVIIRKMTGESRVDTLNPLSTLLFSIKNTIKGPLTSLGMFLYRPAETLKALKGEVMIVVFLSFMGLIWLFSQLKLDFSGDELSLKNLDGSQTHDPEISKFFQRLAKLAITGLIMVILAYPLTLTVPADAINGQASRVHLAARIGASILLACACAMIFFWARIYQKKKVAAVILSAYFALLVGFGMIVQQDYRLSWQYQKSFWTDVIRLSPDIDSETIILVDNPSVIKNPVQRGSFDWSVSSVLKQIYKSSNAQQDKPRVHLLKWGWQENIVSEKKSFVLNESTVEGISKFYGTVESDNVILLQPQNGKLIRRTEPLIIEGREFPLKQIKTAGYSSLEKGHLYDYLIQPSHEKTVNYLK